MTPESSFEANSKNYLSMKSKKFICVSSTRDSSFPLLIFICGIVGLLNTTLLQKSYANISMALYKTDHSFQRRRRSHIRKR